MLFFFQRLVLSLSYYRLFGLFSCVVLLAFFLELWCEPLLVNYFFPSGKCAAAIYDTIVSSGRFDPVTMAYISDVLVFCEVISFLGFLVVFVSKVYWTINRSNW